MRCASCKPHVRMTIRAQSQGTCRAGARVREWGRVAQLGERCVRNAEVGSSILPASNLRSLAAATARATVGKPTLPNLRLLLSPGAISGWQAKPRLAAFAVDQFRISSTSTRRGATGGASRYGCVRGARLGVCSQRARWTTCALLNRRRSPRTSRIHRRIGGRSALFGKVGTTCGTC